MTVLYKNVCYNGIQISCMVTVQLICIFVFACRFFHDIARFISVKLMTTQGLLLICGKFIEHPKVCFDNSVLKVSLDYHLVSVNTVTL